MNVYTKPGMVIKEYFDYRPEHFRPQRPDGSPLGGTQDFMLELKKLNSEEKYSLAVDAAKELGYTPEQIAAIEKG